MYPFYYVKKNTSMLSILVGPSRFEDERGLCIIDIDKSHNGLNIWNQELAKHENIDTYITTSGSGGKHYYFLYEDWMKDIKFGSNIFNSLGIEFKHKIILAGKSHKGHYTGNKLFTYENISKMPDWLKNELFRCLKKDEPKKPLDSDNIDIDKKELYDILLSGYNLLDDKDDWDVDYREFDMGKDYLRLIYKKDRYHCCVCHKKDSDQNHKLYYYNSKIYRNYWYENIEKKSIMIKDFNISFTSINKLDSEKKKEFINTNKNQIEPAKIKLIKTYQSLCNKLNVKFNEKVYDFTIQQLFALEMSIKKMEESLLEEVVQTKIKSITPLFEDSYHYKFESKSLIDVQFDKLIDISKKVNIISSSMGTGKTELIRHFVKLYPQTRYLYLSTRKAFVYNVNERFRFY